MSIANRANTVLLVLILIVGLVMVAMLARDARGGPLDPPRPPASTQRNVIYQPASGCAAFPIVLSTSGSYRLGGNITGCAGKNGIEIATSNLSLDLGGFTVSGVPASDDGIHVNSGINVAKVSNGFVVGWGEDGVDMGDSQGHIVEGVMSAANGGAGFIIPSRSTLTRSASYNNLGQGILVLGGSNHVTITDCQVGSNGLGIFANFSVANTVRHCVVANNGGSGIAVGGLASITDNHVHNNAVDGIVTLVNLGRSRIEGNWASANGDDGFDIPSVQPGFANTIVSNTATGNAGGNYDIGANNDAGPIVTAAAAVSATSNISN